LAIFSWHILSLGLITGWLLNNGDKKQNSADLKTINVSWCWLTVHFCFEGAQATSMTCQLISIYFNLFWSILIILIILIYFDHFDLFWSFLILASKSPNYFDHQTISIARRPFQSVLIQDLNCQSKASQASCTLSTWVHVCQPFMIPAPSCQCIS
jgi:hypothetical protein